MINKRSLWFLTLFSLILVLSVYYVTMPSELLLGNNSNYTDTSKKENTNKEDTNKSDKNQNQEEKPTVQIEESDILTALRVEANDQMLSEMDELKAVLTNEDATVDEKNNAFEKMKELNITRGEEETLEKKILDEFKLQAFVKIDGDQIRVVVASEKHDSATANNIMRSIQSNYDKKMYISVKFQK